MRIILGDEKAIDDMTQYTKSAFLKIAVIKLTQLLLALHAHEGSNDLRNV